MTRTSHARVLLLVASIFVLLAQTVTAAPICRCAPVPGGAAPCHGDSAPVAPRPCCESPVDTAAPCGASVLPVCCKGQPVQTAKGEAVLLQDNGPAAAPPPAAPVLPALSGLDAPAARTVLAPAAAPHTPAWLRHRALLN